MAEFSLIWLPFMFITISSWAPHSITWFSMGNSCHTNTTISPFTKFFKNASIMLLGNWVYSEKTSTISKRNTAHQLGSYPYEHCWNTFSWLYSPVCVVTVDEDKSSPMEVTAIIGKIKKRSIMEWFVSFLKGETLFK